MKVETAKGTTKDKAPVVVPDVTENPSAELSPDEMQDEDVTENTPVEHLDGEAQEKIVVENTHVEQEAMPLTVVVAAYSGTEQLLHKLWTKFLPEGCNLRVVPTDFCSEILPLLIADGDISDEFIFVPANCAPVAPVEIADLTLLKVYTRKNGTRLFGEPLPMLLRKGSLVELLADEYPNDEALFAAYAEAFRPDVRPTEVSHEFGNFVTMILRSTPCENVVIAGLCQRKFIAASAEGWNAITHLLAKLVS